MRIAFLVTHLLGTGHLARTAQIADAFTAAGHDALILSGGMPAPLAAPNHASLQQLPPIRSDAAFTTLMDATGEAVTPQTLAARIDSIRQTLTGFAPDVLVTELFPFGRRKLASEFEAGIDAARSAMILCSIRDILQLPRKAGRKAEAEDRLTRLYDGILFHGDPALAPLDASWPLPPVLRAMIHETGYIGDPGTGEAPGTEGHDEIIVAAGGGAVGDALFTTAMQAAIHQQQQEQPAPPWRLLTGRDRTPPPDLPPGLTIEPARPDFRALLSRCRVAVLQCGYNTAMDVIATGTRAVFCPFEGDGETEQLQRARAMASRYGTGLLRECDLTAETLIRAIRAATPPDFTGLRLGGAARSVTVVETLLKARP